MRTIARDVGRSWSVALKRRWRDNPRLRRWAVGAGLLYILGLHVTVFMAFTQTNLTDRVLLKLGLMPHSEFTTDFMGVMQNLVRIDREAGPHSIVFLGDSHIRRLDLSGFSRPTVNLSASGETSARLLARLPHYRSLRTADAVVLGVGINDLAFRDAEAFALNMEQVVNFLPRTTPLVVKGVMPVDEGSQNLFENADVATFNRVLHDLCAARQPCIFVDVGPALEDGSGNLANVRHTGDGIHLQEEAQALLRGWMAAGVDEALEASSSTR